MHHEVTLPNGQLIKFRASGKRANYRDVSDGSCFLLKKQVWEKAGDTAFNLSDFNDAGEIAGDPEVELLESQE